VPQEGDAADGPTAVVEGDGPYVEHPPGRAEEPKLPLPFQAPQRPVEELPDGVGGERVAARAGELFGDAVAEDHFAPLVDDDHAVGHVVEGGRQPDAVALGLVDSELGPFGTALDAVDGR